MLASDEEASTRAIGWNLRHDDRVSEDRADEFFGYLTRAGMPSNATELRDALERYYMEEVSILGPSATYLSPCNCQNIVTGKPRPRFDLGHVINLSGLLYRIRNDVSAFLLGINTSSFNTAEEIIESATTPEDLTVLVDSLLGAYHLLQKNRPLWCAKWKEMRANFDGNSPQAWNQAVGV